MFVKPHLADSGDPATLGSDAVMEPKLDGHRAIAVIDKSQGTPVRIYARSGVDKTHLLSRITFHLQDFPDRTILDGEIVDPDKGWSGVQSVLGSNGADSSRLEYVVFDVIQMYGEDVTGEPLRDRRKLLEAMFERLIVFGVRLIEQEPYTPERVAEFIDFGFEGAVIKSPESRYCPGKRGRGWIKVKFRESVDVVCTGAIEGKGSFAGLVGALTFANGAGGTGQCSGMTLAERRQFTEWWNDGTLIGRVLEIEHYGKLASGSYRHPQFKRLRTDKTWRDCDR